MRFLAHFASYASRWGRKVGAKVAKVTPIYCAVLFFVNIRNIAQRHRRTSVRRSPERPLESHSRAGIIRYGRATEDDKNSCRWLHNNLLTLNYNFASDTIFSHQFFKATSSEASSFPQLLKKW
jgi:hypothetical protein